MPVEACCQVGRSLITQKPGRKSMANPKRFPALSVWLSYQSHPKAQPGRIFMVQATPSDRGQAEAEWPVLVLLRISS